MQQFTNFHSDNYPWFNSFRLLQFEKNNLHFLFYRGTQLQNEIRIKAGYEFVSTKFFNHNIPTEIETEYAINYIEDKLMSSKELVNKADSLLSVDKMLTSIFSKNYLVENCYTRSSIENLFNAYSKVIMGGNNSDMHKKMNKIDFSIILLLREIMHHLNFESIRIVKNSEFNKVIGSN